MTVPHDFGRHCEELAAAHLAATGWQIVQRNYRFGHREIDVIARRGDLEAYCLKRFGVHVTEVEALATLAHAFTHFSLDIRPLRVRVSALVPNSEEPGIVWLPLEEARGAAIPAPVRRILASL